MALEKGTLNGVDIVQDSATPGVPVVDVAANGGDIVAQNAGVLALRRSPTVVDVEADLLTWPTLVDGGSYQCLGFEAVDDGGGKLYTYHLTGRSVLESGPAANRTYWIDGPGGTDYFIDVELKDRFVELANIAPLVQAILDNNEPVYIPPGYYYFSDPVVLPYRSGAILEGVARSGVRIGTSDSDYDGPSTRIRCNYTESGPAILVQGSEATIKNITLLGATPTTDPVVTRKPEAGIMIVDTNPAGPTTLGSGKHDFYGISVYAFDVGLQIGLSPTEENNDMIRGGRVVFEDCATCIWQINQFAMDNVFSDIQFRKYCDIGFRSSGGGHVTINDSTVLGPMTMFYSDGFSGGSGPGINNRLHEFNFVKVDLQALDGVLPGDFKLIDGEAQTRADVTFRGVQTSKGPAVPNRSWSEGRYSTLGDFRSIDPSYADPTVITLAVPADLTT